MYERTQYGWVMLAASLAALAYGIYNLIILDVIWPSLTLFAALVVVLMLFYRLTVTVDDTYISLKMGIGLIKAQYPLSDITSCKIVRNKWWYGWGIRFMPLTKIYNVSGLSAVELAFENKQRKVRIGTDRPEEVSRIISMQIQQKTDKTK